MVRRVQLACVQLRRRTGPVFIGTRVPAQTLFDYLADGCDLEEFLDNFPTVKREQALQLLTLAAKTVQAEAR